MEQIIRAQGASKGLCLRSIFLLRHKTPGKELKKTLRKYSLANIEKRGVVDLRDYADVIVSAVTEFAPGTAVTVCKDCYIVNGQLSQSQAVKIGRRICESSLSKHCIQLTLSKLFIGKEVVNENRSKSKQVGGHH